MKSKFNLGDRAYFYDDVTLTELQITGVFFEGGKILYNADFSEDGNPLDASLLEWSEDELFTIEELPKANEEMKRKLIEKMDDNFKKVTRRCGIENELI